MLNAERMCQKVCLFKCTGKYGAQLHRKFRATRIFSPLSKRNQLAPVARPLGSALGPIFTYK